MSRLVPIIVESCESGRGLIVFECSNVTPLQRLRLLAVPRGNDSRLLGTL